MATLPTTGDDLDLITFVMGEQPGYTHKLDIDQQRVRGTTDERDAVLPIPGAPYYAWPVLKKYCEERLEADVRYSRR